MDEFVYTNNLKRKLPEDSPITLSSPKKSKTVHSLDYQAYRERVSTFSDPTWCKYNLVSSCSLYPQHLARYGWEAKGDQEARFVKCVSCGAILYLRLPEATSATYRDMVAKQEARVSGGHSEFCPWSSSRHQPPGVFQSLTSLSLWMPQPRCSPTPLIFLGSSRRQ